jgi:hypothetical protein
LAQVGTRRFIALAHRLAVLATSLLLFCGASAAPDAIRAQWQPALGEAGPRMLDRLVARRTPGCVLPARRSDLESWVERTRRTVTAKLGLDLGRDVLSAKRQRRIELDEYAVDVVRLEVFPGLYLPANVYVPRRPATREVPLVVTPTGCGSGVSSAHVQARAATLASMGMVVLVTEGFCNNGSRASLPDNNPQIEYGRQLLGLPGSATVYLQELISAAGWVLATYPADPDRIGAAGYSYGGQMALYLAQVDPRIRRISVPATDLGGSCDGFELNSDIWLESSPNHGPDYAWGAPLELPVLAANWRIAMLFPRALHTTAGRRDWGAHPDRIGAAMRYAGQLYANAGVRGRVWFRTDDGDHNYGADRRSDTYAWLGLGFLEDSLDLDRKDMGKRLPHGDLVVDIAGTSTLLDELLAAVDHERARRFRAASPTASVGERVAMALSRYRSRKPVEPTAVPKWEAELDRVRVRALGVEVEDLVLPAFRFESTGRSSTASVVYLPCAGTRQELSSILPLVRERSNVVSVDYLGIGELKSDRALLHTYARYFMHDDPSLPGLNVDLLRSLLRMDDMGRPDVVACGWASSTYALVLKHLEPGRVGKVFVSGMPADELGYLASGAKIPDLLLEGGFFKHITASELAAALPAGSVIFEDDPAR